MATESARHHHRHRAARVARARPGGGHPPPRSSGASPRPLACSRATCACPGSAPARRRRRWSSSASAARRCSTRRSATRSAAGTPPPSTTPGSSPSASPTSTSATSPRRASRCASRSRSACARRPTLGEYKDLEVGKRDAGGHRRGDRRRGRPHPRALGEARHRRARRRQGRLRGDGLRRLARRRAVRWRRGPRPDGRARLGPARPRLRGPARGRLRRRRAHGLDHLPRGLPVRGARRPRGASSPSRSRRSRPRSCPSSTTSSPPRPGFDTLDELREDIRERMSEVQQARIEAEFREAALDSAVKNATVEIPDALVESRSRELWDQMLHSLSHQGIYARDVPAASPAATRPRSSSRARRDAEQALRREAVLAAIVEAEGVKPTDEEVMEAVEQRRAVGADLAQEALRAPQERGPPRAARERPRAAQGARSRGRLGDRDHGRAGPGARQALDPRSRSRGSRGAPELWTPGS